jgi:hypothetical protein
MPRSMNPPKRMMYCRQRIMLVPVSAAIAHLITISSLIGMSGY